MIYPKFLTMNNTIGICAPSQGVGHKLDDLDASERVFRDHHWYPLETASVRNNANPSAPAEVRGNEFNKLLTNDRVDFIMSAAGGDFLYEVLPFIDFAQITNHPKWVVGASDPTSILYTITTKYDVATIYGFNAANFEEAPLPQYLTNAILLIQGKNIIQKSSKKVLSKPGFLMDDLTFDMDSPMKATINDLDIKGRCIGGCIDVLKDLMGTPFDGTREFIERYKEDGIIWYFDNFALSVETFYLTMLQMKYSGYFEHTPAVLIGRECFYTSNTGMTYEDVIRKVFPDIPVIYNADIGHQLPHMTMINGAIMNVNYHNNELQISFALE